MCELEAYAVNVDDFDGGIGLEVFSEFGDVDVHAACGEVGVVLPDFLEGGVAVDELVEVDGEDAEEVTFFGCETLDVVADGEGLMDEVESEVADFEDVFVRAVFVEGAAHGGVEASEEFFHGEGLGDVVVGADFETFEFVFFKVFGGEEDDGDFFVDFSNILSDSETVFEGHHDIKDAGIDVFGIEEGGGVVAVFSPDDGVAFLGEIGFEDGTQIGVVFSNQKFNSKIHNIIVLIA